jgi:hypothetical protein
VGEKAGRKEHREALFESGSHLLVLFVSPSRHPGSAASCESFSGL